MDPILSEGRIHWRYQQNLAAILMRRAKRRTYSIKNKYVKQQVATITKLNQEATPRSKWKRVLTTKDRTIWIHRWRSTSRQILEVEIKIVYLQSRIRVRKWLSSWVKCSSSSWGIKLICFRMWINLKMIVK